MVLEKEHTNREGIVRFVRRFDPTLCHGLEVMPYRYNPPGAGSGSGPVVSQDDAPRLLDLKLSRRRRPLPDVAWVGRDCDPYHTTERYRRLTRRLIEVLAKHGYPFLIMTRFPLVLRDIDLIREVNESNGATVVITVSSLKRKMHRALEPGTPPPSRRLETLARVRRSGVQSGIALTSPVHGLDDPRNELGHLFRTAADMNLDFILFTRASGLGFPEPESKPSVGARFVASEMGVINAAPTIYLYRKELQQLALELSRKYKVPLRMRRYLPPDYRRENYWLAGQLADRAYYRWLEGRSYQRHLTIAGRINSLKEDIRNVIRRDELQSRLKIDAELRPELEELTSGRWCAEETVSL